MAGKEPAYITFTGLYNGETVKLPTRFYKSLSDLTEALRHRLSPSDYLEILKGEKSISEYGFEHDEFNKCIPAVRKKLEEILESPEDDRIFARPRYLTTKKTGVSFRANFRYTRDEQVLTDAHYIISVTSGLSKGYSRLLSFWDSRTGLVDTRFAAPALVGCDGGVYGRKISNGERLYVLHSGTGEARGYHWSSQSYASYLLKPSSRDFQSFNYTLGPQEGALALKEGILAAEAGAIPEISFDSSPAPAPWYKSEEAAIQLLHRQTSQPKLFACWDNSEQQEEDGIYLNLSSLMLDYQLAKKRRSEDDKKEMEQIIRHAMIPEPSDGKFDRVDIGQENEGYVLFTRFEDYYDCGSDLPDCVVGLLTPKKEVLLFPTYQTKGQRDFRPKGRLIPYSRCVTGELDRESSRFGDNLSEEVMYVFGAPYVSCMKVSLAPDGRHAELVMGLNVAENDERMYIIELDLEDFCYEIKKEWQYESHKLVPTWVSKCAFFLRPESDTQYSIIQAKEGQVDQKLADLYIESSQKYAIVLPDGRYAGAPGCESILEFSDGERVIGMKALAPWRNRPAEVLEALGGNPDDIASLRETTKRWLRKQGFDPENMPAEPSLDNFPVAEVKMPDLFSSRGHLSFQMKLKATAHGIKKAVVRADGVLIPQSWDSSLDIAAGEEQVVTVEVPLACGQNWIEITPIDSEGISGDTTRFRTIYEGNYPSDLFIVALGVSDYDDPDLKLQYAAKDAKDIAAAFEKYGTGRKHVLVLTDKEVKDRSVLEKVKIFLSTASLEDRIVFYVAGHGMLDDKLNYYYAPAEFDAERITETGIPMEELTACIRDSQARHRLLLLDTCHSGLLGEEGEEKLALAGVQLPHGVRAIQNRGMKVKKAVGALNANQKKRYIEDMFSQGDTERGINIIAGAAGAEFALESDSWNNGVFTASVISALRGEGGIIDLDGDGFFSVEELQQRVSAAVQQQTGGRQRPSIVSAEGAENMVIAEGVGYYAFKQLIMNHDWDGVIKLINRNPKVSDESRVAELIELAVIQHVPFQVLKHMLDAGWINNRNYNAGLSAAIDGHEHDGKRCMHYDSEKLAIAKAFVENGMKGVPLYHYEDNDSELVQLMLENGAEATSFPTPFYVNNSIEIFRLFVKYGIDVKNGELDYWTKRTDEREAEAKVEYVLSVIKKRVERASNLKSGDKKWIIEDSKRRFDNVFAPPLWHLAFRFCMLPEYDQQRRNEILEKMKILLENGMDPNKKQIYLIGFDVKGSETTPLHVLCRSGKISFTQALPAIKLLIKHGADIHLKDFNLNEPLDSWDPNYQVLVQMAEAAKAGRELDSFESQVSANSSVQTSYYQAGGEDRSTLDPMIANMRALRCREATSQLYQKRLLTLLPLIRNGSDVNITLPETKGNTALHYACGIGSWSITQWLVEHGADVNAVTNAGKTPLDCVGSDNAARIRELLISRGGRRSTELSGSSSYQPTQVGDADEWNNLGLAYQYGKDGKPKNYSEAARYYRMAAEQGHAGAQNNLGFCYHNGWGVPKDMTQAAMWYKKSADQGNAWGQSNYGTCLEFGWGVKKNLSAAIDMYCRAAAQGHASAKKHLKRHGITM